MLTTLVQKVTTPRAILAGLVFVGCVVTGHAFGSVEAGGGVGLVLLGAIRWMREPTTA